MWNQHITQKTNNKKARKTLLYLKNAVSTPVLQHLNLDQLHFSSFWAYSYLSFTVTETKHQAIMEQILFKHYG